MVWTYKLFTGERMWRNQTGEISSLWCTTLIFTRDDGQCFISPVVVHQITHCTQDIHYNIPSEWVIQNSQTGYMDHGSWHKSMSHFASVCWSSSLNNQGILYDGHDSNVDDRVLYILRKHNINPFILKSGDSVHFQPNYNCPNIKLNNLYGNEIMNWMIHHRTLKFTPAHMNYVLVATWESFKL